MGRILLWILFVSYGACVLAWLVERASGLYLYGWSGGLLPFFGMMGFGFAILIWSLSSQPLWPRWRIAGPALLVGALAVVGDLGVLTRWSNDHYLRQPELIAFAERVHAYGRISEMHEWSYKGFTHALNGTVVRPTREELDSVPPWVIGESEPALLRDVLVRDSIDPAVYEDVREHLRRFQFSAFWVRGDYVAFRRTRDGGLVFAAEGAAPLERGAVVPGTRFEVGRRSGRWYFFWCCVDGPISQPVGSVDP